jgi:hypothetical protein
MICSYLWGGHLCFHEPNVVRVTDLRTLSFDNLYVLLCKRACRNEQNAHELMWTETASTD